MGEAEPAVIAVGVRVRRARRLHCFMVPLGFGLVPWGWGLIYTALTEDQPTSYFVRGMWVPGWVLGLALQLGFFLGVDALHRVRRLNPAHGVVRSRYAVGGVEFVDRGPCGRERTLFVPHRGELVIKTEVEQRVALGLVAMHKLTFRVGAQSMVVSLGGEGREFSTAPLEETCRRAAIKLTLTGDTRVLHRAQREEPTPFL